MVALNQNRTHKKPSHKFAIWKNSRVRQPFKFRLKAIFSSQLNSQVLRSVGISSKTSIPASNWQNSRIRSGYCDKPINLLSPCLLKRCQMSAIAMNTFCFCSKPAKSHLPQSAKTLLMYLWCIRSQSIGRGKCMLWTAVFINVSFGYQANKTYLRWKIATISGSVSQWW